MIFRGKPLDNIDSPDLQRLVDDQVAERLTVEYKKDMYASSDGEKREMLRDISAIANAQGGYLIIGMEETKGGIPKSVCGVEKGHRHRIMNSCLDGIDKPLSIQVHEVPLENGKEVLVVSIPASLSAPHMVTFQGEYRFWKRYDTDKRKMTVDEVRQVFEERSNAVSGVRHFLAEREQEILETIGNEPTFVFSTVPVFAVSSGTEIIDCRNELLRSLMVNPPFHAKCCSVDERVYSGYPLPTLDGLRADEKNTDGELVQSLSVHRNGYLEFVKRKWWMPKGSEWWFASVAPFMYSFFHFAKGAYQSDTPSGPVIAVFTMYNARGLVLGETKPTIHEIITGKTIRPWPKDQMRVERYSENFGDDVNNILVFFADRIYNAYGAEKNNVFIPGGRYPL